MDTILKSALTDPALFHALSLVLALSANNNVTNVEILTYRGELLNGLSKGMQKPGWAPQVSTITAMLMLIGYEYRIDGGDAESIAIHVRGVQAMMRVLQAERVAVAEQVQRALFWQDLLSCLVLGTPRLLSHNDYRDFRNPHRVRDLDNTTLLSGFREHLELWPSDFTIVLQDLTFLCDILDNCLPCRTVAESFPIDNSQANLESRLVNLLYESRLGSSDAVYEACIFAAYLCTYKLSSGIWGGCFVPELCADQILRHIMDVLSEPALLLWLLLVVGGLTEREDIRLRVTDLVNSVFSKDLEHLHKDWLSTKALMRRFIWSERTMESKLFRFWTRLHLIPASHRVRRMIRRDHGAVLHDQIAGGIAEGRVVKMG
jgi:hypothetical protein